MLHDFKSFFVSNLEIWIFSLFDIILKWNIKHISLDSVRGTDIFQKLLRLTLVLSF